MKGKKCYVLFGVHEQVFGVHEQMREILGVYSSRSSAVQARLLMNYITGAGVQNFRISSFELNAPPALTREKL